MYRVASFGFVMLESHHIITPVSSKEQHRSMRDMGTSRHIGA
jgi:hypothetical protein